MTRPRLFRLTRSHPDGAARVWVVDRLAHVPLGRWEGVPVWWHAENVYLGADLWPCSWLFAGDFAIVEFDDGDALVVCQDHSTPPEPGA